VARGRVALVTGSSRGLGAEIARRLARDGFAVAVNGRPGDEGVAAVARAIRDDGGTAAGFSADVTDEDQVTGLVTAITGALGPVDVLVLNATGPQPEAPVTEAAFSPPTTPASSPASASSSTAAAASAPDLSHDGHLGSPKLGL
jgi:3-oxoacyl-[acyl-carrier protein] reductase